MRNGSWVWDTDSYHALLFTGPVRIGSSAMETAGGRRAAISWVALTIMALALAQSSRRGTVELAWRTGRDSGLVAREAASLRDTIATAEGAPGEVLPGPAGEDDVALGDVGGSIVAAASSPGETAIAEARRALRRAQRAAQRTAALKLAEAEKAKLEKRVQKERVEYTRVALEERAQEGEEEAKRLRKRLLRREAHLAHLARERRRQREARAEVKRAKKWTQHQEALRQLFAGKVGTHSDRSGGAQQPTIDFSTSALAASALPHHAKRGQW